MRTLNWGKGSLLVRAELHPKLVQIVDLALLKLASLPGKLDMKLIDGLRTQSEANANAAKGTGSATSKHRGRDGVSLAVDVEPIAKGRAWNLDDFRLVRGSMLWAADDLEYTVRSGSDWDADAIETQVDKTEIAAKNIPDFYHIELVEPGELRYLDCINARERRITTRLLAL